MKPGDTIPINCQVTLNCPVCHIPLSALLPKGAICPSFLHCAGCHSIIAVCDFSVTPQRGVYTLEEVLSVLED